MEELSRIICENLTEEIIQKYQEDWYQLLFEESVMKHDLGAIREVDISYSMALKSWSKTLEEEFYKVYDASFKDRPGFPGWSMEKWMDWISSAPAFPPDLTFLATIENQTVGFIARAKDVELPDNHGYIIQVGVIPEWRRKGVAAVLTNISLKTWCEDGKDAVILHVNRNNPAAIRLYERLGFKTVRIRGAFER